MSKLVIHNGKNISLIHHKPYDKKNGLGMPPEELLKMGALIDEIPEPENKEGFFAKPFYDEKTNTVYYEYFKITDDEIS